MSQQTRGNDEGLVSILENRCAIWVSVSSIQPLPVPRYGNPKTVSGDPARGSSEGLSSCVSTASARSEQALRADTRGNEGNKAKNQIHSSRTESQKRKKKRPQTRRGRLDANDFKLVTFASKNVITIRNYEQLQRISLQLIRWIMSNKPMVGVQ